MATPFDKSTSITTQTLSKFPSKSLGNVDLVSPLSGLPRLLNVSDAARALCVSRRTIYTLIDNGELKLYRVGSTGALRIRREDLEALLVAEV